MPKAKELNNNIKTLNDLLIRYYGETTGGSLLNIIAFFHI